MNKINKIITDIRHNKYEGVLLILFALLGLTLNYSFFKMNTLFGIIIVCILIIAYAFLGLILLYKYIQPNK